MNKLQPARVLGVLGLAVSSFTLAQNFQQIPLNSSSFNADVIANGVGTSVSSTNNDVDGVSYAFISRDFQLTSSSTAITYGFPMDRLINTAVANTPGLSYKLAPYDSNNSLRLAAQNESGTLTFATPVPATKLYMLATGGSASTTLFVTAVINFTDGTSQTFTSINIPDWYGGSNFAIQGIGRINKTNDGLDAASGINPRLYQILLSIDAANQTKPIQSVTVTKTSSAQGYPNVFAFSADVYSDCVPPVLGTTTNILPNSADVSWTAATNAVSYEIYHSNTNTAPTSSTSPTYLGITGTTKTIDGLTSNTNYYYWVRSNCSTATNQSVWSFGGTFKTACSTFTVPYTENFDTTSTGSTTNNNAPSCWAYLESASFAGYGYVIGSNSFSAPNSYYLYNSSATTGSQMLVSPPTINLSDGTKRVRFYAKSSSAGVPLQIGTLTNPTDTSTFTQIGSAITLTTTQTLYTVNIPAGSDLQLAFKHGLGTTARGIYIDNITVQTIPTCFEPTAITSSNINANTATIGWTAPTPAPANGYEVYYSTTNVEPASNVVLNASNSATSTTLSAQINGLAPSTTYYAWVRSNCGTTDKSIWSLTSTTFSTPCLPITALPWNENFDNMTALGSTVLPNCWKQTAGGSGQNFTSANASGNTFNDPRSAPNYVTIYYPYNNPAYLWTPMFSMTGGVTYDFSFFWVGDGLTGWQNEVLVNNSQLPTGATSLTTFLSPTDTAIGGNNSTNYTKVSVSYTPTTTGDYSFAIKANNTTTAPYYMGFDDFSVSSSNLAIVENSLATKNIKVSPNPFNDIINISEFKDIKSIKVSDVSGRTLKTIENPGAQINLGELNAGLYLLNLQFKDGSQKSVKVVKK